MAWADLLFDDFVSFEDVARPNLRSVRETVQLAWPGCLKDIVEKCSKDLLESFDFSLSFFHAFTSYFS